MVYLYSVISGFRAILGFTVIQAAMALSLLFFVTVPTDAYLDQEPYAGANADVESALTYLWWQMLAAHILSVFVMVFSEFATPKTFNILSVASVGTMAFYVFVISAVLD